MQKIEKKLNSARELKKKKENGCFVLVLEGKVEGCACWWGN